MSSLPITNPTDAPNLSLTSSEPDQRTSTPTLDESHYQQLEHLVRLAKPARKAASYAGFSGWMTLMAGVIQLPFAIRNPPMLLLCVVLAGIGTRELSLRRKMLRLDSSAPKKLALNQIVLGITLASYAIYKLMQPSGPSVLTSSIATDPMLQSTPEVAGMLDGMAQLEQLVMASVYVLLIVLAVFVQGGTAGYYALKSFPLRRRHKQTPLWCLRVYQAANPS